MARTVTHHFNTRSITKRVNHVTTFKNTSNMFKMDAEETLKTYIVTDYIVHTKPKNDTIKMEAIANHMNCETNGKC